MKNKFIGIYVLVAMIVLTITPLVKDNNAFYISGAQESLTNENKKEEKFNSFYPTKIQDELDMSYDANKDPRIIIRIPPDDFDPVRASDEELAFYGIPPRPKNDPKQYERWKSIVSNTKYIKPEFSSSNISSRPIQKIETGP